MRGNLVLRAVWAENYTYDFSILYTLFALNRHHELYRQLHGSSSTRDHMLVICLPLIKFYNTIDDVNFNI